MDYKRVLRLHFVNHLSGREIAESCGDCSKTTVNEFLKRFRENPELSYPLPADVTNEYIESILYKKPGVSANQLLYRDFNKEAVYKALARKGETLKHLWQKYNAVGVVDGKKPMSYRQYCRRYSEWADSKQLTFHIQRYPGVNLISSWTMRGSSSICITAGTRMRPQRSRSLSLPSPTVIIFTLRE